MFLSHRCLGYMTILLQCLICSLLVYALIIGSGDMVVSGCQKIGFYNYCLYNKTIEDCQCITQIEDLSLTGRTNQNGLVLAIILTYSSLIIVIMGILTITFAQCFDERILWTFALGLNWLCLIGLSLGMAIYVSLTWDVFDISQVTPGFLAVMAALCGLSVLCCIIKRSANLASEMSEIGVPIEYSDGCWNELRMALHISKREEGSHLHTKGQYMDTSLCNVRYTWYDMYMYM
ncbi:PREDICTED: transmembrane protein 140 [Nanorana parkeri]|uniref:transmembrane protein 140 n=1 Tax=Nanorana parkeri TaxID=125878 RepID=UPI0008540672|nr:PREDICTED: transmembrane protein 140 [Nanorana parkeri]